MNFIQASSLAVAAGVTTICCLLPAPVRSYDLCDSVVDGYMELREELNGMGLDPELAQAADNELYGGYMDSRELTGCY